jgi:hypothetical protein
VLIDARAPSAQKGLVSANGLGAAGDAAAASHARARASAHREKHDAAVLATAAEFVTQSSVSTSATALTTGKLAPASGHRSHRLNRARP